MRPVTLTGAGNFGNAVRLLGDGVGTILVRRSVKRIQFGTQDAASQGPQGIAFDAAAFLRSKIGVSPVQRGKHIVERFGVSEQLWIARPIITGPILFAPIAALVSDRPLMKPGLCQRRG